MMRGFSGGQAFSRFGMMGNFGWFGMLVCLIIIVLVIVGIVWLIKTLVNRSNKNVVSQTSNRSIEILNERYAKGEITKEEYDTIRKSL